MRNPKCEIRDSKEAQGSKTGMSGGGTRSVLECGDSSPLSVHAELSAHGKRRSSGAVQTLARSCGLLAFFILHSAFCHRAWGQSYSIGWSTIDGGGGTSTGSVYSVSGTIGQPDAGTMSGGNFTLQGGFWSIIATVPTPVAPSLSITLNPQLSTITVSWPSPSTGWNLQQNTNSISSLNWSNVTSGIVDDGTTKRVIVNPPAGDRFYRLRKP